jgi:PAS domain S-box-containing protein
MESLTQRSVVRRYLIALLAPAVMAGVMQITWPLFAESPIALFLLAIMFAGWYGGFGPGALSLLVSIPLADYFFIYPYYSLGPQNRNDLITLLVLTTIGLFISLLSEWTLRERRHAEVNLESARQAEEKYRNIFDNALEGIFRTSPEGRFLVANSALAGMFGFNSTEELIIERADISKQHYVDPMRRDEFKRLMEAEGTVHQFEYEAYRKDGSRIWVSDNVRAVRNGGGKVLCYEGIAKDITERKRAERRSAAFAALAGKLSGARVPLSAAQTIADTAQELFSWDSFVLKLYDADQDRIHPLLYIDTVGGQFTNVTPETGGTEPAPRSRFVINYGAQLTLREAPYEFDEDSVPFGDTRRPSASVMTVPIRHSAEVIGILSIQSYRAHAYDHEALSVLQALADHCGAALNRIRAEEALRTQREILQTIFDHIPAMICFFDRDGHIRLVNREWERWRGWSLEEISSQNVDLLAEGYPNLRYRQEVISLAENSNGKPYDLKTRVRDGRVLDTTWSIVNLSDGTRIGLGQDITERKQAEDALRASEERYRELFENAKDATYVHDLNGRYISVNRAAEKLAGHTREEIIGRKFSDFIPLEEVVAVTNHLCQKLKDEGETIYESEVFAKDGRRVPVEVSSHLIYENGIAIGVQGTARDITERRRAEERLREYEKVVEGLEEMIVVVDRDFRFLLANRAYLKYRGKNREDVLGRLVPEVAGQDLFARVIKGKLEQTFQGHLVSYELKTTYSDLGERDVLSTYIPIEGPGGIDRAACVIQDITERKRAEEALQRYPRQLIEAQEMERQNIARELHDQIGQVLTAIRLNLQTVWETCESSESRALIDEGVAMVDGAVEQVRDLSFELRPSLLDDLGLVAALRWYCDRFARRTGIRATHAIDFPESTRLRVELETACFRIVQEAFTNVARHARARTVSLTLKSLKNQIYLSIKDDGRGFDTHSQLLSQSTSHLGLRGMRERALALGGRLKIKSSPSRGTEISAHFPWPGNSD